MTTPIITNKVSLMGQVSAGFQFSHKRNGICYYMAEIKAERTSGYADHIPVIVSEKSLTSLAMSFLLLHFSFISSLLPTSQSIVTFSALAIIQSSASQTCL